MFLSLDYLYVPAKDIEASVRYYTEQLDGELVWKIHAFNAWVAAIRLSPTRPMVLLADHLHEDTPILIYRVERLESTIAALRARGWTAESGPFEVPNGPCYTFRDPMGVRLAIYENQRPEVVHPEMVDDRTEKVCGNRAEHKLFLKAGVTWSPQANHVLGRRTGAQERLSRFSHRPKRT